MPTAARKRISNVIGIDRARISADLASEGWLTVKEAAELLHMAPATVYDHCYDNSLPNKKHFGRRVISKKAVRLLLEGDVQFDESWAR